MGLKPQSPTRTSIPNRHSDPNPHRRALSLNPSLVRRLRTSPVKWILLLLGVLLDIAAAISLFDYTYFRWPPPDPIPIIGVVPIVLASTAAAVSIAAILLFVRTLGARRLFAIMPILSFAFAALCLWLIWDYPRAYDRFMDRQVTRIKELNKEMAERMAEKQRHQDNP